MQPLFMFRMGAIRLSLASLAGVGVISLVAGIGITTLGPGGVLATIALYALTPLTSAQVAGTAIVTHIGTGLLGSAAYVHSGQLRESMTRKTAFILAVAAVIGTPIGVWVNSLVSKEAFSILLGLFVAAIGVLVWYREHGSRAQSARVGEHHPDIRVSVIAAVGLSVAAASGLFGVGGPMLSVPLLVALGLPLLPALAAAQVQSIIIATVGTLGYLADSAICWSIALLVGIPELIGVLVGWKIAHNVPVRGLKNTLAVALVAMAPYLALHGVFSQQ